MKDREDEINEEEEESNQLYEIIDEKLVNVKSVSFKELKIINDQKENSVFKILKDNKPCGTGFLCIIPFSNKLSPLPVLITCNHVLTNEDIQIGKEIKLIFNDKIIKKILIDKSRRIYTSKDKKYDITIIEIKGSDNFNINKILEIDYDIYSNGELNNIFSNESIYLIHYPDGLNESLSINIIQKIDSNNINIEHLGATKSGSSGAPIINLNTFKVIGIHTGRHRTKNFNCGIILRKPIEEFSKLKREKSNISIVSSETCLKTEKSFISQKPIEFNDIKKNEVNLKIKVRKKILIKMFIF